TLRYVRRRSGCPRCLPYFWGLTFGRRLTGGDSSTSKKSTNLIGDGAPMARACITRSRTTEADIERVVREMGSSHRARFSRRQQDRSAAPRVASGEAETVGAACRGSTEFRSE